MADHRYIPLANGLVNYGGDAPMGEVCLDVG